MLWTYNFVVLHKYIHLFHSRLIFCIFKLHIRGSHYLKVMEDVKDDEAKSEGFSNVRSVVLTGKGSFDLVKVVDWPLPNKCRSNEVRVAVEYCGVNFADVYHIQGQLVQCSTPYVLGLECAGKVSEIGSDIGDLHVGDRVVCYRPETGLFRETVIVPRTQCFLIPQDICSKIACSLLANYLTAFFALFELGYLRSGETILIHSAAGGVGWAATQLASNVVRNVKIYGTSSASKHADIVNNGVELPLTYDNYISEIEKPEVDLIIDNIGGKNVKDSLSLLRPLGRVILTGANCVVQKEESKVAEALQMLGSSVVPMHELVMGNKAVCGLHLGTLLETRPLSVFAAVQQIFCLCQQGAIEPRVHSVFPFHKANEAIKTLADRKNIGKILLKVA